MAEASALRLARWRTRIGRAREARASWERHYQVEEAERFFLGEQGVGQTVLNHFTAIIKTTRPNLFFTVPKFYLRPKAGRRSPVAERVAAVGESVLEAIARQNDNLEEAAELALLQAFFRLGVLKTVYDPRMEPNPAAGELLYEQGAGGEPVIAQRGEPMPKKDPLSGEVLREPDEVMTDEVYRWEWVDAASLLLPDAGPDLRKWPWIAEEVVVPLEVAQGDARFPSRLREHLVVNRAHARDRAGRAPVSPSTEDEGLVEYVECYDLRAKRWAVIVDGQDFDDFLVDNPVPRWIDDHPYAILRLGEPILGPDPSPWPVPVVRDWLEPQREYNTRRRQITEGAKRSARKLLFTDGAFPDEEEARKALQSPTDLESVRVNDLNLVRPLEERDLNPVIYKDIPLLFNDLRVIAGTTGARQADPDADTATEATFVERAANLRESDAQKWIARWMSTAGRKMLQCVKDTLTLGLWVQLRELDDKELGLYLERVYQVPLEMQAMMLRSLPGVKDALRERLGRQRWLQVTREDLQFEADVTVVPGSTRPRNLDMERRQWLEFLRVVGSAPQLLLSRELTRYTAEKFDLRDERLLDELTALAQQMVQVQARQAGREQGPGAANGQVGAILSAMTGGAR